MANFPGYVENLSTLIRSDEGFSYRDLNKNGKLDIFEDPRQNIDARLEDLLSQMTIEEKAGTLFIHGSIVNEDGSIEPPTTPPKNGPHLVAKDQMDAHKMTHFNLWDIPGVEALSIWSNRIQQYAEETRLGIPVTIASDPRNHFSRAIYEMAAEGFSQ